MFSTRRLERELRVGGKAAAFEYAGQKFPLGAVGTPLALPEASFTESQLLEKPGRFAASLFRIAPSVLRRRHGRCMAGGQDS